MKIDSRRPLPSSTQGHEQPSRPGGWCTPLLLAGLLFMAWPGAAAESIAGSGKRKLPGLSLDQVSVPGEEPSGERRDVQIRARAGLSTLSGLVALEVGRDPLSLSVGFLPRIEKYPGALLGMGVPATGTRMAVAIRLLRPISRGHGLFIAFGFVTNNEARYYPASDDPDDPMVFPLVQLKQYHKSQAGIGYHYTHKQIDVTVGGGYGIHAGVDEDAKAAGIQEGEPVVDATVSVVLSRSSP